MADFADEVRRFLAAEMADADSHPDPRDLTGLEEDFERAMHRRAGGRGWLSLGHAEQAVFNELVARADAPLIDTAMTLAGVAIAAHRPAFLPRLQSGEVEMCIAYTEAAAGSDLAAIAAVGQRDGDGWALNGTKVLVTGAHKADWCVTVLRTDPNAAIGAALTMFLVPMDAPGVSVTRRETMNGWTLGDIDFVDVLVGPDAVLGEVGKGWAQMLAAVTAERSGTFWLGFAEHALELLVDHVRTSCVDDPFARDIVAELTVELAAAQRLSTRVRATPDDVAMTAMVKVVATELLQRIAQAATEIAGMAGLVWAPLFGSSPPGAAAGGRFAFEYLERIHPAISVGANEVQRDTIARFGLRLPRRR